MVYNPKSSLSQIAMKIDQGLASRGNDLRRLKRRSSVLFLLVFLLIVVGLTKIIKLTVIDRQEYFTESEKNRIINIPIYPARGLIKLSSGEIVAENIVTHQLVVKKSLLDKSTNEIEDLKEMLYEDRVEIEKDKAGIVNGSDEVTLFSNLNSKQLAKYQVNKERWPSIYMKTQLRRFLPHKNVFSHVVGHLGEVTKEEARQDNAFIYQLGSYSGKVGLEKKYETEMRGKRGVRTIEVDVFGNQIRELRRTLPKRPLNLLFH